MSAALGFVEAFAKFGAKPDNAMWAASAIAEDGALVMSCWSHYFRSGGPGLLHYGDRLSRWSGNKLGNSLLKAHLGKAFAERLPVRMVLATTAETESVDNGHDASKVRKTFQVRSDVVGTVVHFDGDNYLVEFRRAVSQETPTK